MKRIFKRIHQLTSTSEFVASFLPSHSLFVSHDYRVYSNKKYTITDLTVKYEPDEISLSIPPTPPEPEGPVTREELYEEVCCMIEHDDKHIPSSHSTINTAPGKEEDKVSLNNANMNEEEKKNCVDGWEDSNEDSDEYYEGYNDRYDDRYNIE